MCSPSMYDIVYSRAVYPSICTIFTIPRNDTNNTHAIPDERLRCKLLNVFRLFVCYVPRYSVSIVYVLVAVHNYALTKLFW